MKCTVAAVLSCILLLCSFSGCAPELHERLIIRAVGVDLTENGYSVTVRAAKDDGKEESFTDNAVTVAKALERIAQRTGKKSLYSHNALVVLSEECAKEGLQGALDFFLRHYDSRPSVKVFLTDSTAENILTVEKGETDIAAAEQIAALLKAEKFSGMAVDADLISLINGVYGPNQSAILPILHKGDALEIQGAGIISNMRLCAELDLSGIRGYLLLCGKLCAGESVFVNTNCGEVSIAADKSQCKIQFAGTKDTPRFTVDAEIEGDISSISAENRKIESYVFEELEKQFAASLLQDMTTYLNTSLFDVGCDAAGFGHAILCENTDISRTAAENLFVYLKDASVDIRVRAKINRVEEEDKPYF